MDEQKRNSQPGFDLNAIYSLVESVNRLRGHFDNFRKNMGERPPSHPRKINFQFPKRNLKPVRLNFKPQPLKLDLTPLKNFLAKFKSSGSGLNLFKTSGSNFNLFKSLGLNHLFKPFSFSTPGRPRPNYKNMYLVKRTFLTNRLIVIKPPNFQAPEKKVANEQNVAKEEPPIDITAPETVETETEPAEEKN